MEFCRLTHPRYRSDQAHSRANPIQMLTDSLYVPGMACPACANETGGAWASSGRVRVEVHMDSPLRSELKGISLPPEAWRDYAERLRRNLQVPSWMPIVPGAELGMPKAEVRQRDLLDFLHPFPGQIIVRARVVDALLAARLSGFQPIRVHTQWAKQLKVLDGEPPELYELFVTGSGWRSGITLEAITVCQRCGRTIFPASSQLVIDESRWDGSDFFHIDQNPNIVIVTARVREVLVRGQFTNWECTAQL